MTFLVDVNVLVSLIDDTHEHHSRAIRWFISEGKHRWYTCPIVENGALRVSLNTNVQGGRLTAPYIVEAIRNLYDIGEHQMIADDISILDSTAFDHEKITSIGHITDVYLVALAAKHAATLATFDRKIKESTVKLPDAAVLLL